MCTVDKNNDPEFEDYNFSICTKCNTIQLGQLVELSKLYQSNHNIEILGEI